MSNENKTEINWTAIIVAVVCFVNMYWAFSGNWGIYEGGEKEKEPVLGFICLIVGLICLVVAFSKETK
jgi:hypothetical protein